MNRLNYYASNHIDVFGPVIKYMKNEILPKIELQSFTGHCVVELKNPFLDQPFVIDMIIDVLLERGFYPSIDVLS